MRMICMFAVICLVAGCGSSIQIDNDYDPDANFSSYKTYDWIPQQATATGNAQQAEISNTLLDKRIKEAVNLQLSREGVTRSSNSPDLLVAYHAGIENKVDVTDWGYSYGSYYYGYPRRDVTVYQYQKGTLIVDLIEASSQELVWRGSAQATLLDNPTPEKVAERINSAVGKMFNKYPPK